MVKCLLCLILSVLSVSATSGEAPQVTRGPFQQEVVLHGSLSASVAEKIFVPRTDSWRNQIKWMVEEGASVEPGDVVARFDNSGMLDKVDNLYREILSKKDELATKTNDAETAEREQRLKLESATIDFEKAEIDARVPQSLISEHDYQQRQLAMTKARKELELVENEQAVKRKNTEAEIKILQLDIAKKEADFERQRGYLESLEIKTRSGGVVIYSNLMWQERKVQVGDTVNAGFEIMQIPDLNSLEVETFVSETDLALIKPGMTAQMRLDAYPKDLFTGKVIDVSNRGETRSEWGEAAWFAVRISLDDLDDRMRPGMSVRIAIKIREESDVLLVPVTAAFIEDGSYHVRNKNGEAMAIEVLGADPFHLAVPLGGSLQEGMELQQ